MALVDEGNITLGLGTLELGTYDVNDNFTSYSDIGALCNSLTIQVNRTNLAFKTGRPQVTVKREVTDEDVMVSGELAELTLANLKLLLGGGTITSSTPGFLDGTSSAPTGGTRTGAKRAVGPSHVFKLGGVSTVDKVGLRYTHKDSENRLRVFEGWFAVPTGALAIPWSETDWQRTAFSFGLDADTTRAEGEQYFQLVYED